MENHAIKAARVICKKFEISFRIIDRNHSVYKQKSSLCASCSMNTWFLSSNILMLLLSSGYEVLYLIEPVDEYCIQSLPEFEGKKFQNVAKEGLKFGDEDEAKQKAKLELLEKDYEPLMKWMKETGLKDLIEKATISQRLTESPLALVASSYGWSANMERIMSSQAYAKAKDPSQK